MASGIAIVPHARQHMRPLQQCLSTVATDGGLMGRSSVDQGQHPLLSAVVKQQQSVTGLALHGPHSASDHTTDISLSVWGVHLQEFTVQGIWSPQQRGLLIKSPQIFYYLSR